MAWPNPFYRRTANTRTCWGYTFELSPDHLSLEQAHKLKHSYDTLAEDALEVLNELFPPEPSPKLPEGESNANIPTGRTKPKRDLYVLLRDNHHRHPTLTKLWNEVTTIPDWVDWDQISRGQEVFYRYGGPALTGLAYQSLLGGMGANRVVEVLSRTGGFSVKVARHRLFETTQHILECTRSLDDIKPLGDGFASSLRVRLLHSSVRNRILKLAKTRPDYYSIEKFGVPINDLDSIATIGTFSGTLIWLSFPRQGIFLSEREKTDYIALWRLIAHYLGTPTSYFAEPHKAKCMMESLLMNEINPSQTSQVLANNIIRALENQPPTYATRSFLEANARWLNGRELCDALGLGTPSLYHTCLVAGQCLVFMFLCYTHRAIPSLDRRKIARLREVFWALIVESKIGLAGEMAVFDFKYVPSFETTTYKGVQEEKREIKDPLGEEKRNLGAFVVGTVFLGFVSWVTVKTGMWAVGGLVRGIGYGVRAVQGLSS